LAKIKIYFVGNIDINYSRSMDGMHTRFWWESQEKRDHQEDLHIGGRIILKWILEE
jgi:hypothetical protein